MNNDTIAFGAPRIEPRWTYSEIRRLTGRIVTHPEPYQIRLDRAPTRRIAGEDRDCEHQGGRRRQCQWIRRLGAKEKIGDEFSKANCDRNANHDPDLHQEARFAYI
jgi:hypothetical protein